MHMQVWGCCAWHMCGGQRMAFRSPLLPSTVDSGNGIEVNSLAWRYFAEPSLSPFAPFDITTTIIIIVILAVEE